MTRKPGIRRPNRRRVLALQRLASGEFCDTSGKISYPTRARAEIARAQLAVQDPQADRFRSYACEDHWHVGHSS